MHNPSPNRVHLSAEEGQALGEETLRRGDLSGMQAVSQQPRHRGAHA